MSNSGQQYSMRKKRYVSHKIQGSLLAALIILQVILITLATLYLYFSFNDIMDQQIYSIHQSRQGEILELFFMELIKVIIVFSVINLLVLFGVYLIWDRYLKGVLSEFAHELENIKALDFADIKQCTPYVHEVICLVQQWKYTEKKRCTELTELLQQLEQQIDAQDDAEKLLQTIDAIEQKLP